jgi:single-stranded-DNA-specific exonuclease
VYVLSSHNWHSGIIGIVASKLSELFYRPCILISIEDGKGKASGRSIEEMNLFDALSHCEELLTAFGGHSQAAGLSISEENIDAFRTKINEYAKNCFRNKTLVPRLYIDCPVDTKDITLASAKMIARLEPFGMGNEVPVFSAKDMRVLTVQTIGQDNKHLRLYLSDGKNKFNAIGFNMGEMVKTIRAGYLADIAFSLNVNLYNGVEYLQLVLKDVKAHSE